MTSTSEQHQIFRGGNGDDTITFPLPIEPGFEAKGHSGQDRLRLLPNSNPSLLPKVRIDQKKGTTKIRGLVPYTLEGTIKDFSEVFLPARATTIYKGTNKSEMVTAHVDYGAKMYTRGGSDVLIGSSKRDHLDAGSGYDVVRAKGGNDTCKNAERRSSC